jgi:hypothetical protein
MKINYKSNLATLAYIIVTYLIITLLSLNNCYFWDNISYTAVKSDWIYSNLFKSTLNIDILKQTLEMSGFYPPTIGIMTAMLWSVFGRYLWVSHAFIFLWSIILAYNSLKLIQHLFPLKNVSWILLITLFEATVISQLSIAGLDLILLTAFIISLRAIFDRNKLMLSIGIFFLCTIQIRGLFVGVILLVSDNYFQYLSNNNKYSIKTFFTTILPYLPSFLIISIYVAFYFWAYIPNNNSSILNSHYSIPNNFLRIIKHFLEFGLRSVENGRIIIWIIAFYVAYKGIKNRSNQSPKSATLLLLFLLISAVYLIFIFTTQMPFSDRYFMPQFFVLTLLSFIELSKYMNDKKLRFVFVIVLLFELSGHLWIYPERIAKSWDSTLAHLPYYDLRKQCFNYIDENKINYNDISAGFTLYGDRKIIELSNKSQIVAADHSKKYFIYSNISNLEDNFVDSLKNTTYWHPMKSFQKGFAIITIYKNQKYKDEQKKIKKSFIQAKKFAKK